MPSIERHRGRPTSIPFLTRLLRDRRGSSDLTVSLLLTAAGAAMVCITLPTLFAASKTASKTFQTQVSVLERGADPGGNANANEKATDPWSFQVGPGGVTASGPLGNGIHGTVSAGSNGVSGSASGGGAPASGGGSGASSSGGATAPSSTPSLTAAQAQQRLLEARTN